MSARTNVGAAAPGRVTSTSDKADGANVGRVGVAGERGNQNSDTASLAPQALRVIEGERKAAAYLARLQAKQADPDELALIVSMLYGASLRGFCRVLAKALGMSRA